MWRVDGVEATWSHEDAIAATASRSKFNFGSESYLVGSVVPHKHKAEGALQPTEPGKTP